MAMHLRRALSHRTGANLLLTGRTSSLLQYHARGFSHIVSSRDLLCNSEPTPFILPIAPRRQFFNEIRRSFAKGKKSKDDSVGGTAEVVPDIGPTLKANTASQMDAAVVALSRELAKLRTGRASAGMLDHIIVETEGVKLPLNRLAVVSVLDSKTLSVNPYDPNTLKTLEKAIVSSPLGLNPKVDGERLVAAVPPLTKEHIQAVCKVVTKSCEDVKQSIRRARQKALDTIKKAGKSLPKDDIKRLEKEVDELTKKYVKSAEDMCKAKEKEISQG